MSPALQSPLRSFQEAQADLAATDLESLSRLLALAERLKAALSETRFHTDGVKEAMRGAGDALDDWIGEHIRGAAKAARDEADDNGLDLGSAA